MKNRFHEKNSPVHTIPDGAYECGTTGQDSGKNISRTSPAEDLQGNGYPPDHRENPVSQQQKHQKTI